jgi:peroxiredoxin
MRHRNAFLRGLFVALLASALPLSGADALQVGDKAPDFKLSAPNGKEVKLSDLLGKGPVVIYTFIRVFNAP